MAGGVSGGNTLDAVRDLDGGSLLAWDPVKAEPRWAVPFPLPLNGGVLSTQAGLVFQGNKFGEFVAYDAETGERLWADKLVGNAAAAPMTYEIDGEQYLSVLSGWGSVSNLIAGFTYGEAKSKEPARVITFKLRRRRLTCPRRWSITWCARHSHRCSASPTSINSGCSDTPKAATFVTVRSQSEVGWCPI